MGGGATAANAAPAKVFQGDDWSTYFSGGNKIVVKDKECDDHAAYVEWNWTGMADEWKMLVDPIGSDPGKGRRILDPPNRADGIQIRTCENLANKVCDPAVGEPGVRFDK